MRKPIAPFLADFPDHAAIIGDMLLGFVDLEFFIAELVAEAISDTDTAIRMIYRLRGTNDRLNLADALLQPSMTKLRLKGPYGQWLGAMRRCRQIRNQYAHCAWHSDNGRLRFCNLQDAAQTTEGATALTFAPIDLDLIREQHEYFEYTLDLALYVIHECRRRMVGEPHDWKLPKSRAAPKLHSPQD